MGLCLFGFNWSTRLKSYRPRLMVTLFAIVLSLCVAAMSMPAHAAGLRDSTSDDVDTGADVLTKPSGHVASATNPNGTPALIPPLPFIAPQIGPIVKRAYNNDVNRRTTAFFPTSLDFMSSIEMPETDERWVRVDLSEQVLVAYQGSTAVRAFKISSGLPGTPTVTGEFRVRLKVRSQLMAGGEGNRAYYLPNVEWVQYFYQDYGLHGTYWHNDFGKPKSHGCVNMTNADAKWLYYWLGPKWDGKTVWQRSTEENPGSLVIVHE